ncbi:MAG: hypothetical protein EA346_11200 [Thioalkalivibrio sp.]|nr:MAG: hypothetical protein EA346_11200 [Thioalkalivibrio sp.]
MRLERRGLRWPVWLAFGGFRLDTTLFDQPTDLLQRFHLAGSGWRGQHVGTVKPLIDPLPGCRGYRRRFARRGAPLLAGCVRGYGGSCAQALFGRRRWIVAIVVREFLIAEVVRDGLGIGLGDAVALLQESVQEQPAADQVDAAGYAPAERMHDRQHTGLDHRVAGPAGRFETMPNVADRLLGAQRLEVPGRHQPLMHLFHFGPAEQRAQLLLPEKDDLQQLLPTLLQVVQ